MEHDGLNQNHLVMVVKKLNGPRMVSCEAVKNRHHVFVKLFSDLDQEVTRVGGPERQREDLEHRVHP